MFLVERPQRVPDRIVGVHRTSSRLQRPGPPQTEKADVAEHPEAFDHVGLLVNEPPGPAELLFI
jgi:hypothetical protein